MGSGIGVGVGVGSDMGVCDGVGVGVGVDASKREWETFRGKLDSALCVRAGHVCVCFSNAGSICNPGLQARNRLLKLHQRHDHRDSNIKGMITARHRAGIQ